MLGLKSVLDYLHPPKIATARALQDFVTAQASYIAQRTATEYCRAKVGNFGEKLFHEKEFLAALEISRWEAFAAVLADVVVVVEALLRPAAAERAVALAARLEWLYKSILTGHPLPQHRPEGWADHLTAIGPRLAQVQLAAPQAAGEIGRHAGNRIFETLPIHQRYRRFDQEVVVDTVRFQMISLAGDMQKRINPVALLRDLLPAETAALAE